MISRDLNALKEHTKNLQNILSSIKLYESKTNIHLTDASSTNYQIQNLQSQVRAYETQLQEASKQTVELKRAYETQLQEASKQTAELNSQIRQLNSQVYMLENEITVMRQSIIWLLVMRYHNSVVDRALPCGTRRRRTYDLGLKGGRILLNDGWKHFWLAFSDYRKSKAISFKGINKDNAMPRPKMIPIESYMQKIDKTISIIIPTRDAGIEFEHTLEKLKNQKYIKEIEIIIVDSGSEDDTVKIAEKYTSKILKIKPEEFNHGETRNYGASKATGDYILFMVQDAIPIGNYLLYNMIRVLEIDENVAAVTCRQVPRSDADLFACNAIWNHYQYIEFNKNIVNYVDEDQINNLDFQNKRRLSGLDNVCSCIRRDVFHKFKFKRMNYAEDLDLGLRLVKEGYKLCFLFTSGVIHSHNRDQFYYLRRSYVDRKSLITISGEPPSEKYRNLDLLVNELLAIYNSLLYSLTLLNAVDNNEMRVDDSFLEIKNALYGGYHEGVSNSVVNREFHLMISDLGNMVEHTIKNDHIFYDDFISLMCSLQTYLTQRAQIYRVDDLIEPIFKIFATYCGSCLGCSYYYGSNDKRIQYIDQILTRGV
jgi:glycosyltransferase involved in cell wall biosynthesis